MRMRIVNEVNLTGKVKILPAGYNSEVTIISKDDGKWEVIKIIGVKKAILTEDEAQEFARDITTYHKLLTEVAGNRIPPLTDIYLLNKSGKWHVIYHMPYRGKDMEVILRKGNNTIVERIVRLVLETLGLFLASIYRDPYEITVGVDPKPANFSFKGGRINFVDLVPPRYRKNGTPIVEYPVPKTEDGFKWGYFKHYDARGVLLVFQGQLCRIRPELRPLFKKLIIEYAPEGIKDFFKKGIWETFPTLSLSEAEKVVASLTYLDMCTMREIVTELAYRYKYDAAVVDNFFKASHYEDEIPNEIMSKLKSLILAMHQKKGSFSQLTF